jgi:hypothetical protein
MMWVTFAKWSLPLALVSAISLGQQPTAPIQDGAKQVATKSQTAKNTSATAAQATSHHRPAKGRHSKASSHGGAKRPAYRREYTQNSVEVMNGESTQKVVFNNDQASSGARKNAAAGENTPAPLKVEVVNGTASDTQYFYGNSGRQGSDEKRPVVVAVQSSDTRFVGGNKHTVVTGITAVGHGDAKTVSGSGQKVTAVVSPQPKRPEYQPDAH